MLAEVGFIALLISFFSAIYAIVASLYGIYHKRENIILSARNAAVLTLPLISISTLALWIALVSGHYEIAYVWSVTSPSMPEFYRVTSLWGSQAGSLLFWSWLMSAFAVVALLINWREHRRMMPYFIASSMATLVFFVGLSIFLENPFDRYWLRGDETLKAMFAPAGAILASESPLADLPGTARGLNPLLRHFGMAIHPPMLYLGFTGFIIPFAFAIAALASGDLSAGWIKATRRWTLVAWLFLSLGLLLGGRWAYDVLGWGGYWGWDPVENAAFLPWLMGTAYLHSVMIQEKRGMLKTWNMALVILTFSAVIFGTFATRSGLIESVHSFARSQVGFPMFTFWSILTFIAVGLTLYRRSQGLLRDDREFVNLLSRETLFVLNNLIFVALFAAIFWGSFGAPITSELFLDTNITLGTDYFYQVTVPLFAALYLLMGIAPLSAWGITSMTRLGNALLIPLFLTVLTMLFFYVGGMTLPLALIGYGIVVLAGWVAVYETYRGVRARTRTRKENPLTALLKIYRRNPRRYGGYMIHIGVTVIGIGVLGSTVYQQETQQTLSTGESISIGGYDLLYENFRGGQIAEDGRILDIADLALYRDGNFIANLNPRRDFFPEATDMNSMTIAAAHSTLENDFYVLLVGWEDITYESATFKVYINPLVNLVWWGGLILILGTVIAIYPRNVVPVAVRERIAATAGEAHA